MTLVFLKFWLNDFATLPLELAVIGGLVERDTKVDFGVANRGGLLADGLYGPFAASRASSCSLARVMAS